MGDFVRTMHEHSGLLPELDGGLTLAEAEEQVLDYIRTFVPEPRRAPLAGNSIGTDRAFLAVGMPTLESYVHYRNVDVSSVKELARRWFPRTYYASPAKTGNHRALADVQESIEELRYYRDAVFVPLPGPDSATARQIAARHQAALTGATASRVRRAAPDRRNEFGAAGVGHYTRRCAATGPRPGPRCRGGCSSVGRAPGCGPGGRGFKSRHSPHVVEPSAGGPLGCQELPMSYQEPYGYPVGVPHTQVLVQPYRCSTAHVVIAWIVAALTVGYMLPWAIAATRNRSNVAAVALVNLFLGWSLIGWVVALVMACGSDQPVVVVQNSYGPPHAAVGPAPALEPGCRRSRGPRPRSPGAQTPPPPALPAHPRHASYPEPTTVDPLATEPTQPLRRSPWEPDHRR